MNILTFTTLWPNAEQPSFAIFVKHRVAAIAKLDGMNVRVVAPVPYFPDISGVLPRAVLARWQQMARMPEQEEIGGLQTFHPRYLVTPKIGMRFYGDWMARGAWETVQRLHAEQPIDLIDAHYVYPDGYAATLIGERLNVPVVITARGTDINLFSQMRLIRPKIVAALNRAAGIIAVSEALKQRMIELGISAEKIAVIRNGVDRDVFYPRDRRDIRQRLKQNPEDRILLSVGALVSLKGFDRLIEAMALLNGAGQGSRLKLFIIGEGPERRALEAQISNLNLTDCVHLIGAKPQCDLADWYSAADLFCLASHREGCPNVVVEALACGVPVVAADVGGVAELIGSRNCGWLVSSPTAETFAAEIQAALASVWNREQIATASATRSWDEVATDVRDYFTASGKFAKD
ncbi:MAG TPA: glycosyltransferase family 4 protein [Blastocatellia bacterium]|nr:glycosyltransferase family 4 protein [Blastocatellia bacterium]